jgi:RimJ/RimL family protein N-acetyltransferase
MKLTDGRIELRPPEPRDLPLVRAAAEDPYIPRITSVPTPFSEEAGLEWLERQRRKHDDGSWSLVIRDAMTEDPVGFIGLGPLANPSTGQTGYWVLSHARGRGIATSALRIVLRFAFEEQGLQRVQALIEPWNEASIRTAERCGLRREGLLRAYYRGRDVYMYALLAHDPRP